MNISFFYFYIKLLVFKFKYNFFFFIIFTNNHRIFHRYISNLCCNICFFQTNDNKHIKMCGYNNVELIILSWIKTIICQAFLCDKNTCEKNTTQISRINHSSFVGKIKSSINFTTEIIALLQIFFNLQAIKYLVL